jgi:hypothetical protein
MYIFQNLLFRRHLDDGEKIFEIIHRHSYEIWNVILFWVAFGFLPPLLVTLYARSEGYFFSWWWTVAWIVFSLSWIFYKIIDLAIHLEVIYLEDEIYRTPFSYTFKALIRQKIIISLFNFKFLKKCLLRYKYLTN